MAHDIIDAEFETIRDTDTPHPARRGEPAAPARPPESDHEIDILKSAPGAMLPGKRAQILYVLSVLFSSIAAFLVSGGHVLLRAAPATPPAALALEMTPAGPDATARSRGDVVTVSATIRNASGDPRLVPDVLLTFPSADGGRNLVYRVPRGESLAPGKTLAFTVRMPKKPGYAEAPRLAFDNSGV